MEQLAIHEPRRDPRTDEELERALQRAAGLAVDMGLAVRSAKRAAEATGRKANDPVRTEIRYAELQLEWLIRSLQRAHEAGL